MIRIRLEGEASAVVLHQQGHGTPPGLHPGSSPGPNGRWSGRRIPVLGIRSGGESGAGIMLPPRLLFRPSASEDWTLSGVPVTRPRRRLR